MARRPGKCRVVSPGMTGRPKGRLPRRTEVRCGPKNAGKKTAGTRHPHGSATSVPSGLRAFFDWECSAVQSKRCLRFAEKTRFFRSPTARVSALAATERIPFSKAIRLNAAPLPTLPFAGNENQGFVEGFAPPFTGTDKYRAPCIVIPSCLVGHLLFVRLSDGLQ